MPTSAMTALATLTLGSAQATVTFSGISQSYRDLRLVCKNAAATQFQLQINSNSSNFTAVQAYGNGSSAYSQSYTGDGSFYTGLWWAMDGYIYSADILDYAQTDKHKPVLSRISSSAAYSAMEAGRYTSTSAVTTLKIIGAGNNIQPGSTFTLYGVSA
jgi:hypothetical protein